MRGAKLPAFRSTSFPLDWALDWGLDWELYSATGNPFEELLLNCGGLVGNYGQSVRALQDMQAVTFDGATQYVVSNTPLTQTFTASGYFKLNSVDSTQALMGTCHLTGASQAGFILYFDSTLRVGIGDGNAVNIDNSSYIVPVNEWLHVSFSYHHSDGSYTLHVNDTLVLDQISPRIIPINQTAPLTIARNSAINVYHMDGSVAQCQYNGTIYNFQETSGDTVFDRSGNNHATLINNPARVVDNSAELAPYDTTNLDGYTDGDGTNGAAIGVRIPAHSTDPTLDALGNQLEYRGSAYPNVPKLVDSVGRSLDGSTQYVQTSINPSVEGFTSIDLVVEASHSGETTGIIIGGNTGSDNRMFIKCQTSGYQIGVGDTLLAHSGAFNDGVMRLLQLTSDGVNYSFSINGVEVESGTHGGTFNPNIDLRIGSTNSDTQYLNGSIAYASINGINIPFNNTGAYDLASDGSMVSFINNPSVIRQDEYHAEMDLGYREYTDTSDGNAIRRVPLANGVPVDETNKPAGWVFVKDAPPAGNGHNDADTKLNLTHLTPTGDRTPAIAASGQDIQAYTFGDTLTNPAFKRVVSADYEDRHSIFQEELTGGCLTKAQDLYDI